MLIKELNLYRHLIPGLIAGAVGYGVYFAILHTSYLGVYSFPDFASLGVVDLVGYCCRGYRRASRDFD